jgi:indole-3-acetate monooxygenase
MATSNTATKAIEAARAFRPQILAERDRIEAGRRLPEGLARDLARAGFFRIFLPAAYGGLDLTPLEAIDVCSAWSGPIWPVVASTLSAGQI